MNLAAVLRSLQRFPVGSARTLRQWRFPAASSNVCGPRFLSTTSSFNSPPSKTDDTNRIPRTLYRQLLQWCERTDPDIPLSYLVPPIYIRAPEQVDAYRMDLLSQQQQQQQQQQHHQAPATNDMEEEEEEVEDAVVRRARRLLPKKTELKPNSMTVPIHAAKDLRAFFQAIFRLNTTNNNSNENENRVVAEDESSRDYQKQRIAVAFEALKSLNELTNSTIQSLQDRRQAHMTTTNSISEEMGRFRTGQVVQHRQHRWRGVVTGWDRIDESNSTDASTAARTSLTTKEYKAGNTGAAGVRYDVILDEGDLHTFSAASGGGRLAGSSSSSSLSSEWASVMQSDLVPVLDENLMRVRNHSLSDYFSGFDRRTHFFVPNDLKAYKYPLDILNDDGVDIRTTTSQSVSEWEQKLCDSIVAAVQQFARQLEQLTVVEDEDENDQLQQHGLLANVRTRLAALIQGDVLPMRYKFSPPSQEKFLPSVLAAHHVRALLHLSLEIFDVMFHRRNSIEHKDKIKFKLGDIVCHKVFGFRGVVVAWDPTPSVDVSRWDGLQHIENAAEMAFYHVVPDQNDCIKAFGGERSMRYVCEENLEMCAEDRSLIQVDLGPEWQRNQSGSSYIPPDELHFKYGEDAGTDHERATERCMTRIQDAINLAQLQARQSNNNSDDPVASALSMGNMLELLKIVDSLGDSIAVQDMIKEMRKAHIRLDLRWRLDAGVSALMIGKGEEALAIYRAVIAEDPDSYPEAHNKTATCEFMMGRLDESLKSTKKVLELDPTHFQALNGLGLIYFEKGDFELAIDCFRESIAIDPWSPVSSKLSTCLDLVNQTSAETMVRP